MFKPQELRAAGEWFHCHGALFTAMTSFSMMNTEKAKIVIVITSSCVNAERDWELLTNSELDIGTNIRVGGGLMPTAKYDAMLCVRAVEA